jgi:hypothetical protein
MFESVSAWAYFLNLYALSSDTRPGVVSITFSKRNPFRPTCFSLTKKSGNKGCVISILSAHFKVANLLWYITRFDKP